MNNGPRTTGEVLFEKFLAAHNLSYQFEPKVPSKSKRPDYALQWNGEHIFFDVKDFDPPTDFRMGFGAFDPYPRIREKIEQGRQKFREFKEYCCGLVLCNLGHPLVMLSDEHIMLGSMYGDSGFTFPVNITTGAGDANRMKRAFLSRGKMVRLGRATPQNTTISALITLREIRPHYLRLLDMVHEYPALNVEELQEEAVRRIPNYDPDQSVASVIVWHNAVARIPFPSDLFRGPYDTHFGIVAEGDEVFQRVIYRGSLLPDRVKP